jgi:hypothetical protein
MFAGEAVNSYCGIMEKTGLLVAGEVRGNPFEGVPKYRV